MLRQRQSLPAQLLLLLVAALMLVQLCTAHGDPPRLRDLVKKNPKGALLFCPSGETLETSSGDSGQNPGCVPCGAALQYACGELSSKQVSPFAF